MTFTNKTIKHYIDLANKWVNYYQNQPLEDLHVSISTGNDKIGHAWNISILPIFTCPNCTECKHLCYDIRDCLRYGDSDKNYTIRSRAKNTVILMRDRQKYFAEIREFLSHNRKNKMFRFHVGGEIKDKEYFSEMVSIARDFPEWLFWSYTKNYSAVNDFVALNGNDRFVAISDNFKMMFSEWRGMELINPYNFPEFHIVFENDAIKPVGYYCPGNCDICKASKRGCIVGETTYCNEH